MRFLDKPTCEKLVKMGCVSESEFYFWLDPLNDAYKPVPGVPFFSREEIPFKVSAFTLEDFVGTHEQAKENCRILWGLKSELDGMYLWKHACYAKRHKILDSDDWVEFLRVEVEKYEKEKTNLF